MGNDLRDTSEKEGLVERDSLGTIQETNVQTDEKSSESSTDNIGNNASESESQPNTEQKDSTSRQQDRFENNPAFNKQLRDQYQATKRELEEMREDRKQARLREERYMKQLDELQKSNAPKKSELPADQIQARDQLAEILRDSPILKPLFEKLAQVEQFNNSLTDKEMTGKYNEVEKSMVKVCETNGLDVQTELEACNDWLDQHPVLSQLYPKGKAQFPPELYELAFKAINHDRADELADRRANLKSIQERERRRAGNSETPAATLPGGRPLPAKLEDFLTERVRDGIIPR